MLCIKRYSRICRMGWRRLTLQCRFIPERRFMPQRSVAITYIQTLNMCNLMVLTDAMYLTCRRNIFGYRSEIFENFVVNFSNFFLCVHKMFGSVQGSFRKSSSDHLKNYITLIVARWVINGLACQESPVAEGVWASHRCAERSRACDN